MASPAPLLRPEQFERYRRRLYLPEVCVEGFTDVATLSGGSEAWALTVDPTVPRY